MLAKKIINQYYFTDRAIQVGFNISLDIHHISHSNYKLSIQPIFPEFAIEPQYIKEILIELSVIYARLIIQYKFKYQTVFSAKFDEHDENNHVLDATELFITLSNSHNLKETDIDNIDIKSPLEHQIQIQEMKDSGWRFDKHNSMKIYFYEINEISGSSDVKSSLRSSTILNIESDEKYCFFLVYISKTTSYFLSKKWTFHKNFKS